MSFILGKKLKMTQVWKDTTVVPVTVIKVAPNAISFLRTKEKNGYEAVQLALGRTKREFRLNKNNPAENYTLGGTVEVSVFKEGDKVQIAGYSKGRGFAGVVKRYNFGGGPKTHGQKNRHRAPGSIGSTAFQRVVPGRRMAGHMGVERITLKNLKVVSVDLEKQLLFVKGAVPGATGQLLEIKN